MSAMMAWENWGEGWEGWKLGEEVRSTFDDRKGQLGGGFENDENWPLDVGDRMTMA